MKIILFSLGLILTGFYSNAQVISRHNDRNALKLIRKTNKKAPVTKLKGIDIVNILKEDSIDRVKGLPKRFGKSNNVNLDIDKNGIWTSDELGRVWELSIHSKGAHSLNLIFDKFKLPTGASLIIYNEDTSFILGPITHEANNKYNRYSTDLIKGDFATIQLFEPWNQKGKTKLSVSNIIHGYVNIFSGGFGQSESCNNDIACHNDWEIESQAIALVILDNGTRLCSGSLVNTGCNDFQPYFLTAFHCLDSWADGNLSLAERNDTQNWVFRYNYTSPSCNGPDGVQYVSYSGADFISAWAETDFALVELSNQPNHQEVAYAGWERDGVNPTSSVGIHHPQGDVMKISFDNDQANEGNWVGGDNNHWVVEFDDGVVEHVSSGSPLFDQDRRIVGQLHGNDEYNDNLDYCVQERAQYGQFSESWNGGNSVGTSLRTWLTNDPNIWRTNTIVFPQITGTRYLCSEGWNYSITNLPAGSTVSWNASNNITINSNGFASSSVTHETGWIEATITNPCSSRSFTLPRIGVWIGTPNTEGVILQGGYKGYYSPFPCVFDFDYYYGVNVSVQLGYPGIQGMTNYSWSGHASFHTSDRYGAVFAPYNPGGYVMFHAQNACGQSIISAGYGPCGYYSMYPNPATNEVTFGFAKSAQSEPMAVTQSVDSDLSTATFDAANDSTKVESEPVNIIVYDQMQNIVLEKNGTTEKDIKLDTRNLSSGIYIVHVTVGDVLSVKQLVIK